MGVFDSKWRRWFYEKERAFYHSGSLIILLCCCSEYIDMAGGGQCVFNKANLPTIKKYVEGYHQKNEIEKLIKDKVLLGLNISWSMTPQNLMDNEFVHDRTAEYYEGLMN